MHTLIESQLGTPAITTTCIVLTIEEALGIVPIILLVQPVIGTPGVMQVAVSKH